MYYWLKIELQFFLMLLTLGFGMNSNVLASPAITVVDMENFW